MEAIRRLAAAVDTTAVCDADRDVRVMAPELRCRSANPVICGPAVTVRCRGDFLGVIQAIDQARPGDVVVVDGGGERIALAGELFARAALGKRLGGIIVDAAYRDMRFVSTCDLPVYSRHVTPRAGTRSTPATVNEPVTCGGVKVDPGDLVLADHDGILVLDPDAAEAQLQAAATVMDFEARIVERLDNGVSLTDSLKQ
ncbi:RraA family protein [Dactylosporangium sp. CS-047395]|uniref:RraA family protein n=1 Tax=Dactylosporangium sp. CS-047395 TaxID=3239936 RepID=UPI003D8C82E8